MSINKQQAKLIADDFLSGVGLEKDGFVPAESLSTLITLAGNLVDIAQQNLNRSNSNASGNLSASLEVGEPEKDGQKIRIDIFMAPHGLFVNSGVRGTKSGSGLYAFKYDKPSQKMVDAIRAWAKAGKIKTRNVNAKKTIFANEKKNASIGEMDAAYSIARSIVQHGIKSNGFLDKAVNEVGLITKEQLGRALVADVSNALPKKLSDL